MENRFEICCDDSVLIGTRSECDRLSYEGKHTVNRQQLGEYWRCVIEDGDAFLP